jgi:exosortase/archaeosortase family protein
MAIAAHPRPRSHEWRSLAGPVAAIVLIVVTYRISLLKLFEAIRLDTPLAHLALVPFIALTLAMINRRADAGPPIHDRQLDWIVGLTLGLVAVSANLILPGRLSTQYWEWRIDLLTLPVFTAAVITMFFGIRALWKLRMAVLFLFLAWPYPYSRVLDRWLGDFTRGTIWALDNVLHHLSLATRVNSDVFQVIGPKGESVSMSVASACSGANGLVGFLLVAGAFVLVVEGGRWRKLGWLATGALLVWMLNIARILIIFAAAGRWGEAVAIEGFHPYMGLVVFNIGVLIMVFTMKWFGLRFKIPSMQIDSAAAGEDGEWPSPAPTRSMRPSVASVACVGLMALGISVYNGQLTNYDRIANSFGEPRLSSFAESREAPHGWDLTMERTIDGYKRFFGQSSVWTRYHYSMGTLLDGELPPALTANTPITVDVIDTSDQAALAAYGIEQCYNFHGYGVHGQQSVDLGGGVVGRMLTWTTNGSKLTWTTLYWQWPIKTSKGTRYERVTLVMNDQPTNVFTSPPINSSTARQLQLDIDDVLRGSGSPEDRDRLLHTRNFMIGFARSMISLRAPAKTA